MDRTPWVRHRLHEDLIAMRHVPPGTPLGPVPMPEGRRVLEDLLRLADEVDPTGWLLSERRDLVGRWTAWVALLSLANVVVVMGRARSDSGPAGFPPTPNDGDWIVLEGWDEAVLELAPDVDPDAQKLRRQLSQLQAMRGRRSSARSRHAWERLLEDLLDLDEDRDPCRWILERHPDQAASTALSVKYAQSAMPVGQIVSTPPHVNAKLTTLDAAYQLKDGRPLDASTRQGQESNRAVWLVVLRGKFRVPNPVLAGLPASAPSTYHQMALILAATTDELLAEGIYPVTHEVAAAADLPATAVPAATNGITLPRVVVPTEAPLPTRAALGAAPQPGRVPILVQATPIPARSSDRWSLERSANFRTNPRPAIPASTHRLVGYPQAGAHHRGKNIRTAVPAE